MYIHWIAVYRNHFKKIVKNFRRTVNLHFSLAVAIDTHLGLQGVTYVFDEIKKAFIACIYVAF